MDGVSFLQIAFYVLFGMFGLAATVAVSGVGWLLTARHRAADRYREDVVKLWETINQLAAELHRLEVELVREYARSDHLDATEARFTAAIEQLMKAVTDLRVSIETLKPRGGVQG